MSYDEKEFGRNYSTYEKNGRSHFHAKLIYITAKKIVSSYLLIPSDSRIVRQHIAPGKVSNKKRQKRSIIKFASDLRFGMVCRL